MVNPDHLRAAIERIGIEKDSDYTLVMEEVGRMEAEEKARECHNKIMAAAEGVGLTEARAVAIIAGVIQAERDKASTLLSAAEAVLAAGIVNPTGSMKVANAMDVLVKAVREVKG